jgi:hypothetical protein
MDDIKIKNLKVTSSLSMDADQYSFAVKEFSVDSGFCASRQDAYNIVFRAIRNWALEMTHDISALLGNVVDVSPPKFVPDCGSGIGAPVRRRLLEKFGQMTNRQLSDAIGFNQFAKVSLSVFSNALAGKGSRSVRCVIAIELEERPSTIWPFLSEKTRQLDDEVYLAAMAGNRKH